MLQRAQLAQLVPICNLVLNLMKLLSKFEIYQVKTAPSQNGPKSKHPQIGQNVPNCSCRLVKTAPKTGPKNGPKFDRI